MTINLVGATITRPATGGVSRSLGARFLDTFNVKDFGALGNGTGDDKSFIQAALTAAVNNNGGTVYFPAGSYPVSGRLTIPGSSTAALTLLGDGCDTTGGTTGTCINGNFGDYILYIGQSSTNAPKMPVKLIQGIGFKNGATGTATSTEPTPGGNGFGCIYWGSAASGMAINSCDISVGGGIGLFSAGNNVSVAGTNFFSGFVQGNASTQSFGIVARSIRYSGGKLAALGTAFEIFHGSLMIENIDLEVSGYGMNIGQNQLTYWEPDDSAGAGALRAPGTNPITGGVILNIGTEQCWLANMRVIAAVNLIVQGCLIQNPDGVGVYGLYGGSMRRCSFRDVEFSGGFSTAAIALGQVGQGGGNIFDNLNGSVSSGVGAPWILPSGSYYAAGDDPNAFRNCPFMDGGVTKANLPSAPSANGTVYVVCTNSDLPAFTGGASNVGRVITTAGPANQRVLARWNSTAGDYVIVG